MGRTSCCLLAVTVFGFLSLRCLTKAISLKRVADKQCHCPPLRGAQAPHLHLCDLLLPALLLGQLRDAGAHTGSAGVAGLRHKVPLLPRRQDVASTHYWPEGRDGETSRHMTSHSRVHRIQRGSTHLTGVGVGALTCLTGEGDWWRPPVTLATRDAGVGDLDMGLGGTLGGVL